MAEFEAIKKSLELLNVTDFGDNRTAIQEEIERVSSSSTASTTINIDGAASQTPSTTTTEEPYSFALTAFNIGVALAITLILALILAACRSILWQKLRHSKKYRRVMKRLHLDNTTSAGRNQAWSAIISRLDAERNRSSGQSVPVIQELDVVELKDIHGAIDEETSGYRTATESSAESSTPQAPPRRKILSIDVSDRDQSGTVIYARSPPGPRKSANIIFTPQSMQMPNGSPPRPTDL